MINPGLVEQKEDFEVTDPERLRTRLSISIILSSEEVVFWGKLL